MPTRKKQQKQLKQSKQPQKELKEKQQVPKIVPQEPPAPELTISVISAALEKFDPQDYGIYVIAQKEKDFVGVDFRKDRDQIIFHLPVGQTSTQTKEYAFTLKGLQDLLENSSKADKANRQAEKKSTVLPQRKIISRGRKKKES